MIIEANKVVVGRDFFDFENFQKGQYVTLFTEMKSFQTIKIVVVEDGEKRSIL